MTTTRDLAPNPRNPRKIKDRRLAQLKKSLSHFGDISGVVWNSRTGTLVGGHQRCRIWSDSKPKNIQIDERFDGPNRQGTVAVGRINVDGEFHAYREVDWDESTEKAANLAANKAAGDWEMAGVTDFMNELKLDGFDLDLTMFGEDEISEMLASETPTEIEQDDIPVNYPARVSSGDVWMMGDHRLCCGDSGDINIVERLMRGKVASAVVTDPPYGTSQEGVPNDDPSQLSGIIDGFIATLPISSAPLVVFQSARTFPVYLNLAVAKGHTLNRMMWMYKKGGGAKPWKSWIMTGEAVLVMTIGSPEFPKKKPFAHDTYVLDSVWDDVVDKLGGWHGSVKPLPVVADFVERVCPKSDIVYDGFLGSGTTLIACEKTGRQCFGVELTPHYCDLILARWETVTGKKAIPENQGREI